MKKESKENFATEIIGSIKKNRDFWRIVAVVSIIINILQWMFKNWRKR